MPYVVGPQVASEFPPQAGACGTHRLASSTHRRTDGICRKNHLPLGHAIRARNCAPPAPVDSRRGAHENGGGAGGLRSRVGLGRRRVSDLAHSTYTTLGAELETDKCVEWFGWQWGKRWLSPR